MLPSAGDEPDRPDVLLYRVQVQLRRPPSKAGRGSDAGVEGSAARRPRGRQGGSVRMTPEELAAIRADVAKYPPRFDQPHAPITYARALLAHIDAITEILRPEHESPYHKAMVGGCLVCAFLRDTSR